MRGSLDRASAALTGLAVGDALGMPTQTMSVAEIRCHYGKISTFVAPYDGHPVADGLQPAQVTDDTEQTFLLSERLIDDAGLIDQTRWAMDLLAWEADIKERGLRDLLGPSSKAALDALLSGTSVSETGRYGTTNGAAMRIVPVGIAAPCEPLPDLIDMVERACRLTHNTGEAIAAAAAVAAVISCGVDGLDFKSAVNSALEAAEAGQHRGYPEGAQDMAARIASALDLADRGSAADELARKTGTSVAAHESVPAAFGIVRLAEGDPWQAALIAANVGDDTDTIGAIAGAMAGACAGCSVFPDDKVREVRAANDLPVEQVAKDLLGLRARQEQSREHGRAA